MCATTVKDSMETLKNLQKEIAYDPLLGIYV